MHSFLSYAVRTLIFFVLVGAFLLLVWHFLGPASVRPLTCAAHSQPYTIRAGDSCWAIAEEHSGKVEDLIRMNPDFKSPEGHLLYARSLEEEGNIDKAIEEYRVLAGSYPGAEAAVRYAQLLKSQGRGDEAQKVVRDLLEQARIAPAHYRKAQKSWLDAAQRLA